jgi:hypothetical protein
MKTNVIAFVICASTFLAPPTMAQTSADMGMIKTLAENDKLSVTENWLKPGQSAEVASRMGAAVYYIQGGKYELDYKDGTKKNVTRASGTVRIVTDAQPYAPKNIGTTTIHVIVFQPK